jgi:hypothetical protein
LKQKNECQIGNDAPENRPVLVIELLEVGKSALVQVPLTSGSSQLWEKDLTFWSVVSTLPAWVKTAWSR